MFNGIYFILGRDVAAHFEINCTYVLGLACKGAAILEINKRTMKTENRKISRDKWVTRITEIPEYYRNTGIPVKNIGIPVKDTY